MASGANFMDHAGADVGQLVGSVGIVGGAWMFLRWLLTLAGGRQDARIAKLEREVQVLTNRLMVVAQAAMELSAEVERIDPGSASLRRARTALKAAFPVPGDEPADLQNLVEEIDRKG